MKITPSARVLKMLGEIEIAEWQCLAELIDNAFDDFGEILFEGRPWAGGMKVSVSLPTTGNARDAEIVVQDTGRGMARSQLEQAVRAGWSGNDQFTKLGLFGMGFNVSTARLGRRTRVLTTRSGDTEWIGVEIDLDQIGDDFEAPDIVEPKPDPSIHGTRVIISKLDQNRFDWLSRHRTPLCRQLGKVYGWILDSWPFELWVGGIRVKPWRPCRWGDERSVTYRSGVRAEEIPAYIPIDVSYAPAETCLNCGNWQEPGLGECQECDEQDQLRLRERRMHGWVGIQRYLDQSEYGLDFLRNGRKILINDKSVFEWSDIDDPTSPTTVEYPVELRQGGRIIGEIHLDHVPVDYKKDRFERSDRQWVQAINYLRGAAPLLPDKARKLHYPQNDSPISRLHRGYRRTVPGLRCLIPGDGTKPMHAAAAKWARKFQQGDSAYQTDEMWWNQVVEHEESKARSTAGTPTAEPGAADDDTIDDALGNVGDDQDEEHPASAGAEPAAPTSSPAPTPPVPETEQERITRYRSEGRLVAALSTDLGHPDAGHLKVETIALPSGPLLDANERRAAVWVALGAGSTATAFVDEHHDLFTKFGWSIEDAVVVELATVLRVRADVKQSVTALVAMIKASSLRDSAVDRITVANRTLEVMDEVRRRMAQTVESEPERAFQWLDADEVLATENAMIADGSRDGTELGSDSRFIRYVPESYLVRLLEEWPEAFLDGHVFVSPYASLTSTAAQRLSVSRVVSLLADVTSMPPRADPGPRRLQRARLSASLLADELAAEQ